MKELATMPAIPKAAAMIPSVKGARVVAERCCSHTTLVRLSQFAGAALSLGMSGFGYWSHDIGGFEGTPRARPCSNGGSRSGCCPLHSRLHGNASYRVPWLLDEEAVHVLRMFTKLKARLMPYLYRASLQAHTEGVPMMRAMVLEFPDDPACTHLERQYMLGDDLLVAPVSRADGDVSYYVPDGTWTHVLTGAEVTGPRWHRERHSFMSVPLLARPGAVIPVGAVEDRPDYDYADGVTLHVYQLADGATRTARIPVADPRQDPPAVFTVTRTGPVIRVTGGAPAPAAGSCCWSASTPSARWQAGPPPPTRRAP